MPNIGYYYVLHRAYLVIGRFMSTSHDIERLLDELIAREGGYVDHKDDRGGATRFGITEAVARANGYDGAMAALPLALARDIYRRLYWTRPGFERLAGIAPRLAAELFDTGVNMGPAVAVGFLQRALNSFNRNGRDWADLARDNRMGPMTEGAVAAMLALRGARGETVLVKAVNALQGARYIELGEARPANQSFMFGWFDTRI
jgi:lysozyme family protein